MSEAKHTRGPWTFRPNPCECPNCTAAFWIDGAPREADETIGVPVCDVRDIGKQSEANARLIAAAPDLLAFVIYWTKETFEADAAKMEREAEALIAKARGGA